MTVTVSRRSWFVLDRHDDDLSSKYVRLFDRVEAAFSDYGTGVAAINRGDLSADGFTKQVAPLTSAATDRLSSLMSTINDEISSDQANLDEILAVPEPLPDPAVSAALMRKDALLRLQFGEHPQVKAVLSDLVSAIADEDQISSRSLVDLADVAMRSTSTAGVDAIGIVMLTDQLETLRDQVDLLWASPARQQALRDQQVLDQARATAQFVGAARDGRLQLIMQNGGDDPAAGYFGFDHPTPPSMSSSIPAYRLAAGVDLFVAPSVGQRTSVQHGAGSGLVDPVAFGRGVR